jgi:hypothetical protein
MLDGNGEELIVEGWRGEQFWMKLMLDVQVGSAAGSIQKLAPSGVARVRCLSWGAVRPIRTTKC